MRNQVDERPSTASHRIRALRDGYAEAMATAGLAADPEWTGLDAVALAR
jgi:hypothetical protein